MKVEHAGIPLATPWRRRQMEWQREREMELPVAVGHGVVHLFLLEELRDGQQLFQHVLRRHSWRMFYAPDSVRTGENRSVCLLWKKKKKCMYVLAPPTCCAPLSLLKVRSSSEWAAQISCRAARSRDRSVLKCSEASGKSGTFWRNREEHTTPLTS